LTADPVVAVVHVEGLIGEDALREARLANLMAELGMLSDHVEVQLIGDGPLLEQAIKLAAKPGRIFLSQGNLPKTHGDAQRVHLMSLKDRIEKGNTIAADARFIIVENISQDGEEASVYTRRPDLKMLEVTGGIPVLAVNSKTIEFLHEYFKQYTGHDLSIGEFVKLLEGDLQMARKYPIPAALKVGLEYALRLYHLMTRMTEQSV